MQNVTLSRKGLLFSGKILWLIWESFAKSLGSLWKKLCGTWFGPQGHQGHEILTLGHVKSIFYLSFATKAFLEIETHKSKESFAKGIFIQLSLENQLFEN